MEMIDYIVNSITQDFVDYLKSLGYKGYDDK